MKVLLGTTNPSKVKRFSDLLKGYDIEFITLRDIEVTEESEQTGITPEENAIMKAEFYGQYFDIVIKDNDSVFNYRVTGAIVKNGKIFKNFKENNRKNETP